MIKTGSWVTLSSLPPWISRLPRKSRTAFQLCLHRACRVVDVTEEGLLVLDAGRDVDAIVGGSFNDLRVEPKFVRPVRRGRRSVTTLFALSLGWFYSQGDEDRFFEGLHRLRAVRSARGIGKELIVEMDVRRLSQSDLRELIALLRRYRIPRKPLAALAKMERFSWLDRKPWRAIVRGTSARR
jgi:hypothetical protein